MNNPIVENLRGQIQDYRTAEYFKEVLSCYYGGNLRSAVVMLYATVICDLLYKLEQLTSEFGDNGAQKILDDLESRWDANPRNPDWETDLPKQCFEAHKILDAASYSNFDALQKLRHLCAHPALKGNKELYQPTGEMVLGHIVNMLKEVLTRPALMNKDFVNIFLEDIATVQDQMVTIDQLSRYLKARYFNKYDDVPLFYTLFKSLWKLVFSLRNEQCDENRDVNFRALQILADIYGNQFMERFEKENSVFAKNLNADDDDLLRLYIEFVNIYINFYTKMPEDMRLKLEAVISGSEDFKALAIFLSNNPLEHIRKSSPQRRSTITYLSDYLRDNVSAAESLDYNINVYGDSRSFDQADWRYDNLILPYLKEFTIEQLKRIMRYTCDNGQIFARRRADTANRTIKNRVNQLDENFSFAEYQYFNRI